MKKLLVFSMFTLLSISGLFALLATEAEAIPAFSRQIEKNCTVCHVAFPKLNETGRIFQANGFRFPDDEEWQDVKDMASLPVSAEIEFEVYRNSDDGATGAKKKVESDALVEELELLAGAPLWKDGKVSVFGTLAVEQENNQKVDAEYATALGTTFIQINDLVGGTGKGLLNARAGQWDIALPFLSHSQRVIKNRYLAQKPLGVLGSGDGSDELVRRAVELNGQIAAADDSGMPTHRYAVGLIRNDYENRALSATPPATEESARKDRLAKPGVYGSYTVTLAEQVSLGVIYKRDVTNETTAVDPPSVALNKYGVASELTIGPVIGTLGYFAGETANNLDYDNWLIEVLFVPNKKVVLGARYDQLTREQFNPAIETTFTARYNILSNVYTLVEYRLRQDDTNIAGSNDAQRRGRFYLVALF